SSYSSFSFLLLGPPLRSTLFPYTTLFRSGIAAEERRLHQRGAGDRPRELEGDRLRGSAADLHLHELGRALAVAGDLAGEILAEQFERGGEGGEVLALLLDRRILRGAVRARDHGVVGAHVAGAAI